MSSFDRCTRCGKKRILAKTWTEEITTYVGTSTVKHTLYVCPDEGCQQKVVDALEEKSKVAAERRKLAEERAQNRMFLRQAKPAVTADFA